MWFRSFILLYPKLRRFFSTSLGMITVGFEELLQIHWWKGKKRCYSRFLYWFTVQKCSGFFCVKTELIHCIKDISRYLSERRNSVPALCHTETNFLGENFIKRGYFYLVLTLSAGSLGISIYLTQLNSPRRPQAEYYLTHFLHTYKMNPRGYMIFQSLLNGGVGIELSFFRLTDLSDRSKRNLRKNFLCGWFYFTLDIFVSVYVHCVFCVFVCVWERGRRC